MRFFFGRKPEGAIELDSLFYNLLEKNNYNMTLACEELSKLDLEGDFCTTNPMIFQYEDISDRTYAISNSGMVVFIKDDPSIQKKLDLMGLGEALVDDSRFLQD